MKNKKCYLVLAKKNKFLYGAFPRNPEGHKKAKIYKRKLLRLQKIVCIIK